VELIAYGIRGSREAWFPARFRNAAAPAVVVQAAAGEDGMVPTCGGRTGCRVMGWFVRVVDGLGYQYVGACSTIA